MFVFKVTVDFSAVKEEKRDVYDAFCELVGSYFQSGQVIGFSQPVFFVGKTLIWVVETSEKTSFARKNENFWVRKFRAEFEARFLTKLKFELLGENPCEANVCCCKSPSKYVLFTSYAKAGPPLVCADCGFDVPLYRIPKPPIPAGSNRPKYPEGQAYERLNGWEREYHACDNLQMECGFGERWGTRQMSDFHSRLTRKGRELAAQIEERTGVPTYYYLYDYRNVTLTRNRSEPCPGCGKPWVSQAPNENCFDLWCDACRLTKNLTFNPRGKTA